MAVTSIWPINGPPRKVIDYARNPEKTTEQGLDELAALHTINGVVEYAADEMKTETRSYVTCLNCTSEETAAEETKTGETEEEQNNSSCNCQKDCEIEYSVGIVPFALGHHPGADSGASAGKKSCQDQNDAGEGPKQRYACKKFFAQKLTGNDTVDKYSDHACSLGKSHGQGCGQKDGRNIIAMIVQNTF